MTSQFETICGRFSVYRWARPPPGHSIMPNCIGAMPSNERRCLPCPARIIMPTAKRPLQAVGHLTLRASIPMRCEPVSTRLLPTGWLVEAGEFG